MPKWTDILQRKELILRIGCDFVCLSLVLSVLNCICILYSYLFSFFSRHCCQDKSFRVIVMAVVVVVLKCLQSVARLSALFLSSSRFNTIHFFVYVCIYVYVCPPLSMWIRTWIRLWIHWDTIAKPNRFLAIIYLTMLLMQFPLHFATNIYKYVQIHTYIVHTYIHAYIYSKNTYKYADWYKKCTFLSKGVFLSFKVFGYV